MRVFMYDILYYEINGGSSIQSPIHTSCNSRMVLSAGPNTELGPSISCLCLSSWVTVQKSLVSQLAHELEQLQKSFELEGHCE